MKSAHAGQQSGLTLCRQSQRGPLHGLPIAFKDLIATAGVRTTYGSLVHANDTPTANELFVSRTLAAGGVLVGKTTTPEFGFGAICQNRLAGPTANPYDPSRTSGGSSGGSAVAVCTGMAAIAHGTDFGGSCRMPASLSGVVGLRPTAGRVANPPRHCCGTTSTSTGYWRAAWKTPRFSCRSLPVLILAIRLRCGRSICVSGLSAGACA